MRQHTHLPAVVSFVRNHVAKHFHANGPRASPTISVKLLDVAFICTAAESFSKHLFAASGALGQSPAGLLRRAVGAVELCRNLQVRRCEPDPLAADIVHMREDCRDGSGPAGRFDRRCSGRPGGRVEMFDENLVHAIIGGKDPDCAAAELRMTLGFTTLGCTTLELTSGVPSRGHDSLFPDL